eukprot:scaffold11571_cov119-Isochrysis_galbana.AAC.8
MAGVGTTQAPPAPCTARSRCHTARGWPQAPRLPAGPHSQWPRWCGWTSTAARPGAERPEIAPSVL